jgi:eukaryotic-like serine/threonine-protein kinase
MECLGADTVLELVGGQLSRTRIAELAAHLDECNTCRRLVSATAGAESLGGAATVVDDAPVIVHDPAALPTVPRDVYLRLDEIARGGLGRIVRAQDLRTGRTVAIKEMLAETPDAAARFVREAIITANLQHPAIVPVYEVGRWPDGQPFYAMKLVSGRPLSAEIEATREPLALVPHVIAIADALAYAHGEGVIHRDVKPHNVLVGAHGETVVIDWGLARRIDACDPAATSIERDGETVVGSVLGTPAYMAPEQARGERVDQRADVYAIGAILYRALAGCTPYVASTSGELIEAVRRGPPPPLAGLAPASPRDLVAIADRAMARDAAHRYPSAAELAADLRRFTTGQLVRAHRYTVPQRVRRFVVRHRTAVAVAAIACALLAGFAVAAIGRIIAARDVAQRELAEAYVDRGRVELANEHPDRALAFAAAAAELGADVQFIAARALDALPALWRTRGTSAVFVPGSHDLIVTSEAGIARMQPDSTTPLWALPGVRDAVPLGPDALAVHRDDTATAIVSSADGHVLATLAGDRFAVDDTHRWLAFVMREGPLGLYDLTARARVPLGDAGDRIDAAVLVAPDGEHVVGRRGRGFEASFVVVDRGGALVPICERCWLAAAAGERFVWIGVGADGHGQRLVIADWSGTPVRELALPPGGGIATNLVVQRDVAIVANSDGTLLQYLLGAGHYRGSRTVRDVPYAMAFDGTDRIWILGLHNTLTLFDLVHGLELGRWHLGGEALARSDDGSELAVAAGAEVDVWHVPPPRLSIVPGGSPEATVFAADGTLLVAHDDGSVTDGTRVIATQAAPIESLVPIGNDAVLTASRDGEVAIWDRATGAARLHAAGSRAAASPDGTAIAIADPTIVLRDRATGRPLATLGTLDHPIAAIHWTPDGAHVGAIDDAGAVRIWTRSGALVRDVAPPAVAARTGIADILDAVGAPTATELAFSPDGRSFARACPGCAALHDLATGAVRPLAHGPAPGEAVLAIAFSHDGSRILLAYGGLVRLWDARSGAVTATIAANTRTLAAAFSPDDRLVFTGGMDSRLRVWDVASGAEYTGFDLNSPVRRIAISPDGTKVAATSANAVMLWTLAPLAASPARLRALALCRTGLVLDGGELTEQPPRCE